MLNNKTLTAILVVLGVIVAAMFLFDFGKTEKTFQSDLISIDTNKVSKVVVFPKNNKANPVVLRKEDDGNWMVKLFNGKMVPASGKRVLASVNQVIDVKTNRLAARGNEKFTEYQVDSSATHVEVYENNKLAADLIIGKFSMDPETREMSNFVRLADSDEIYEVTGFMSFGFDSNPDAFRDKKVIEGGYADWNSIKYQYPADSSFVMKKVSDNWVINNTETDSAETAKYLSSVSNLNGNSYIDDYNPEDLETPDYTISIEKENGVVITVEGFKTEDHFYVRSSLNPESVFDGYTGKLAEKLFVAKEKFIN